MIEKDLNKVLNYMKQYVENKYEHDSEPMLNWKDLKLVLEEIERLNNIINEFNKLIENEINESKLEEDYDRVDALEYCLATLQELKGSSDKE